MVVLTMSWGDSKFVSKLPPHRLGEKGVRFIFALGKYENRKIGTATIKKYKGSLTTTIQRILPPLRYGKTADFCR